MLELPEAHVLAKQMKETLVGKTIRNAVANNHHHDSAWHWGDPAKYGKLLNGKKITDTAAFAGRPEIQAENMHISFIDGVNVRYLAPGKKRLPKYQLLLEFEDGSAICCIVKKYGWIWVFPDGANDDFYYTVTKEKPSPLTEEFNEAYFDSLFHVDARPTISAKAFLTTKQRIPGLGNGVLYDILFNARIHPKRKLETIGDIERGALFTAVKTTLKTMIDKGGRDTEKDLFNQPGGYQSILLKNKLNLPCHACGTIFTQQIFLGGEIYFCGGCQPLD